MIIQVGDIYSQVLKPIDYTGLGIIREVCRARPSGFMYMDKYRRGHWDGYISLMGGFTKFPTGLIGIVKTALHSKNINCELRYVPPRESFGHGVSEDDLIGITLRDYQISAANTLLRATRGVAKMATNSGKTEVIAAILKKLNSKAVVMVHRKELLYQTAERLCNRLGHDIGKIGDGVWDIQDITVAMVQTLSARNLSVFSDNRVVIVDECHHTSSDQAMNVLFKLPGMYRFGFSGTPLKHDVLSDLKLMALTGDVIVDISNKYMVEEGYSAKPKVYIVPVEDYSVAAWESSYQSAYDSLIVNNKDRNDIISKIAKSVDGTVLVLVERIEHGNILHDMIPDSVFVNGSFDSTYRRDVLKSMQNGGVFIATPIFDEGIDVPSISTLIVACGGNSSNKLLQRLGRGLRKKAYDNVVNVYDFLDDTNMYLLGHSEKRIDTLIDEGFEVVKYEE